MWVWELDSDTQPGLAEIHFGIPGDRPLDIILGIPGFLPMDGERAMDGDMIRIGLDLITDIITAYTPVEADL